MEGVWKGGMAALSCQKNRYGWSDEKLGEAVRDLLTGGSLIPRNGIGDQRSPIIDRSLLFVHAVAGGFWRPLQVHDN